MCSSDLTHKDSRASAGVGCGARTTPTQALPDRETHGTRAMPLRFLLATFVLTPFVALRAEELKLAASFSSHMVFQREMPVPVWGWSAPQSEVTVSFKSQRKTAQADADGRWRVVMEAMTADDKGSTLEVDAAGKKVTAEDILVGDVWLCAGPGIARSMSGLQNPKPEIENATFQIGRAHV